jgi:hypothetical protein
VRFLGDEVHGHAEQRQHEAERGVDRMAPQHHAQRATDDHHRRDDEDEKFHRVSDPPMSVVAAPERS